MNYTKLRKALGLPNLKTLGVVLLTALTGSLAAPFASAASNNMDVQTAYFGQLAVSETKIGGTVPGANTNGSAASTSTVIMVLSYTGSAASSNITIQSGGSNSSSLLTFYAPFGTVDTTIGSATGGQTGGTFDLGASSATTLGQLCDLINGIQGPFALNGAANGGAPSGGNYHCTLVGGIRSDVATNLLPTTTAASGVNSLTAVGGYSVPTSTAQFISLGIIPAPGRHVVLNFCSVNTTTNSAVALQVYGVKAKFAVQGTGLDAFGNPLTDASLAWVGAPLAGNSTTTEPLHNTSGIVPDYAPWIEFSGRGSDSYALNVPPGHAPNPPVGNQYNGHVVVRIDNRSLGSSNETSTNFVTCQWYERVN